MPIVSIIIPVHNTRQFVEHAVQSVLGQTFTDFELLIVDDASTDGSRELVEQLAHRDPRIRFLALQTRAGCSHARNTALSMMSASQFVAFLDSDDAWHPEFLEHHITLLIESGSDCVGSFCWSTLIAEDGSVIGATRAMRASRYDIACFMTCLNPGGNGSCFVVKREAIEQAGPFDCSLTRGEDTDLWIRVLLSRPHAYFERIAKELTHYRKWGCSASAMFVSAAQLESMERRRQKYLGFIPLMHQATTLLMYMNIILSQRAADGLTQETGRETLKIWAHEIRRILGVRVLTMRGGARALLIALFGLGPWLAWMPIRSPLRRGKSLLQRKVGQLVGR